MTLTEENYIKTIYHLAHQGKNTVSTNDIAKEVNAKASSVTDMVKKLSDKAYIDYQKYKGVSLTDKGLKIALTIVRKHRLWELFLVKKLNFSWDEVHEVAEQLEHIKSAKLVNELDAFLEFPTHDPHGDPIPDKEGNIPVSKNVNILDMEVGSEGVLSLVDDSSDMFLKYLTKNDLALGDAIKIVDFEPFDDSLTIQTRTKTMVISKEVAKNLYLTQ